MQKAFTGMTERPCMVLPRRQLLSVVAGTGLTGLGGCLGPIGDSSPGDGTRTLARGECSATAPPAPDTDEGLPDPRSYPEVPPEFSEATVREFVEQYERAFKYNAMLASFVADGNCVKYLELYVVGNETTVGETDDWFEAEVTTRGSYTGTTCPTETGTDTPTPLPHADLPYMTSRYRVTMRALVRDGTVHQCW